MLAQATSIQTNQVVLSSPSALTANSEISPAAVSCAMSSVTYLRRSGQTFAKKTQEAQYALILVFLHVFRVASALCGLYHRRGVVSVRNREGGRQMAAAMRRFLGLKQDAGWGHGRRNKTQGGREFYGRGAGGCINLPINAGMWAGRKGVLQPCLNVFHPRSGQDSGERHRRGD